MCVWELFFPLGTFNLEMKNTVTHQHTWFLFLPGIFWIPYNTKMKTALDLQYDKKTLTWDDAVFIWAVRINEFLFGLLGSLLKHPDQLLKTLVYHSTGLTGRRSWPIFNPKTKNQNEAHVTHVWVYECDMCACVL